MRYIKLLSFYRHEHNTNKRMVGERELVGIVQGEDNLGKISELVYDCFNAVKPTYYFDVDGKQVDYITHATFIANHSFTAYDDGTYWVYPMLTFEDRGTYNAVILRITYYERKLQDAPAESK